MQKSENYDEFSFTLNRKINTKHVQKLVEANKQRFLLDCYPIIVDAQKRIFDGQHRYLASKELGTPVYYVTKDINIDQDSLLNINSHSKAHSLKDKIHICLQYNDPEMLKVKKIWELEPRIPLEISCELLGRWSNGGGIKNLLDERRFTIKYEEDYLNLLNFLAKLKFDQDAKYKGHFVHAVAFFYKHRKLYLTKLLKDSSGLKIETSRIAYKALIEFLCEQD